MNKYYSIIAPAKLNLNLFVKGRTINGMHLLESDICFLELADKLFFKYSTKDIFLQKNTKKSLEIDTKNNLILESLNAFRNLTGWDKKFKIYLDKYIPIGAGLGGGSADAAATLILLRKLFNIEKNSKEVSISNLNEIANKLGSDVPACLESKTLKLSGYGNKIKRKIVLNNYYYLLVNPNIKLSTKEVFRHFNFVPEEGLVNGKVFLDDIIIYNSLLESAIYLAPEVQSILTILNTIPDIVAYGMSGSGSTCFGIFDDINNIKHIQKYFKDNYFIWWGKKRDYSVNRVRCSKILENKF